MGSTRSISFRKRNEVDEIYTFPVEIEQAVLQIRNSVVMVEYQEDGEVLIIAGNLPGLTGYFDNYPGVNGEERKRRREFARELLEESEDFLDGYSPKESTSKSNSGNRSMNDLYVTVVQEDRDLVVMKMWQMLNHMKKRYVEFLRNSDEEEYYDYPSLEGEVVQISKHIEL